MTTQAQRKLAWITTQLAAGHTVALTTAYRSTQFNQSRWDRFAESGRDIVKVSRDGSELQLWERSCYVCADHAKLSALID